MLTDYQRQYYDEPHEALVREEGRRLMEMYDKGTSRYKLGQAILRVLAEKKAAQQNIEPINEEDLAKAINSVLNRKEEK